jgi:hypothetical protein
LVIVSPGALLYQAPQSSADQLSMPGCTSSCPEKRVENCVCALACSQADQRHRRPASASRRDHSRSFAPPGLASVADPAQLVRRTSTGAKRSAAGMGRWPIPWRQARCAAPQARRRRHWAQQIDAVRHARNAGVAHRWFQRTIILPAPPSTASARSRQVRRTRTAGRPRSTR